MKRVIRNKDHGLPLFVTSAACISRFMCGMESELIGGTLKPKYHSETAGRRGVIVHELNSCTITNDAQGFAEESCRLKRRKSRAGNAQSANTLFVSYKARPLGLSQLDKYTPLVYNDA